ncbi:chemotaxis protein CheW [Bacillus tianshenii]|uniref:chemotaxis protein CheW n=1 Tax=Sutcliffiella tianshenii TaxID=1463404 RepID=UPI001CD336B9|nr:chemotaxis protein CheW [Bacillus tianshenii]MCA1320671.1 chemotaxis protein CheW [Bacillus tianshenii]
MESKKLVIFQANLEEYGVSVEYVVSIEKLDKVTPIPDMPRYMKGLMKVRDELIPVLDTRQILFHDQTELTDKSRVIVVQTTDLSAALLVEDAKEILDVQKDTIKPLSLIAANGSNYISGMVNLDKRLIAVIDPGKLVNGLREIGEIKEEMQKQLAEVSE